MAIDHPHWLLHVPHPQREAPDEEYAGRWVALVVLSLGVFIIAIDVSIVGIAGPSIIGELGATAAEVQWVFDAYTITLAGFVLLGGGIGERFGRKGAFHAGLVVFAAGSFMSAYASSPLALIGGRAVSGVGAAIIFPTALAMIGTLFSSEERPRALGIFAAVSAVGLALGPLVGGLLLSAFWVGSVFLVNVPVAASALVVSAVVVPTSRKEGLPALDVPGAVLSVIALGGIVYVLIEGPEQGWAAVRVLVAAVLGLTATGAFILRELRVAHPLFDLRVFRLGSVLAGGLAMSVVYVTFSSLQLLLPQYLQYVEDFSTVAAGVAMMTGGIMLGVLSPVSARFVDRYGLRTMLTATLALLAAGMVVLSLVNIWGGIVNLEAGLIVYGFGLGLVVAPATAAIMRLPLEKVGDGAAVNMITRQVGGALGVAVLGSVAVAAYRASLSLSGIDLDAAERTAVESSLSGDASLSSTVPASTRAAVDATADIATAIGVQWAMLVGALLCAIAAVAAFRSLRTTAPAKA